MIKNLIIAALVAVIGIGGAVAFAQSRTATVDVAVFRSTSDATTLHVATRPEGGRWKTEQQPLSVWATTSSGRWQVSEHVRVTVAVPEPDAPGEQDVCAPPPVSHTKSACEVATEELSAAHDRLYAPLAELDRNISAVGVDRHAAYEASAACQRAESLEPTYTAAATALTRAERAARAERDAYQNAHTAWENDGYPSDEERIARIDALRIAWESQIQPAQQALDAAWRPWSDAQADCASDTFDLDERLRALADDHQRESRKYERAIQPYQTRFDEVCAQ